jgi:AbiU2
MKTLISDQEARFEYELLVFENEVHETMWCFYIWRTLKKAAPKSQKLFHQLNRNAEFWNTVDNSVQSNSLIVLGRIFDKDKTNNVERLLNLAKSCSAIFSKAAFRRRKEKQNPNASHIVDDLMKRVKEPTGADFRQLEEFVAARRRVYNKCYRKIRDKRYAHRERVDLSGVFALTNTTELSKLLTDLKKLHDELWHWYHNGIKPQMRRRTSSSTGKDIEKRTLKLLRSLP